MTLYLRPATGTRFCELNSPGSDRESHETVCEARMDALEPVVIASTVHPDNLCTACAAAREQWARVWKETA